MWEKVVSALVVIVYLVGGLGWVLNLLCFFNLDFQSPYRAEVIRGIGVVSPDKIAKLFNL